MLILAWVAHLVLARRDPRWRVLVWRSAAVGLATIVILTAAPPIVTWRLPRAESIVVPVASSESVVPVADSLPVLLGEARAGRRPSDLHRRTASTFGECKAIERRAGSRSEESGHDRAEPRRPVCWRSGCSESP